MLSGIDLDHVAVAVQDMGGAWPRYRGDLSGEWLGGGDSPGFSFAQVRYANGAVLECLHPFDVEGNDFLRRFLDRNGPGPHHLTYKVPDLVSALEQVRAAGFEPVAVNLDDPSWKEAFLHPKAAPGIVVQLAEANGSWDPAPPPADLPPPRSDRPATLDHVSLLVADLGRARAVFVDLLGGSVVGDDDDAVGAIELAWPGPGRLRLREPGGDAALQGWLGDRPGRVHALCFTLAAPWAVLEARPDGPGRWLVRPEDNLGTRLVLREG